MRDELSTHLLKKRFRLEKTHFTRQKKIGFTTTLLLIINMLRKSLGLEIENFISYYNQDNSERLSIFTKSAFVQSRKKISPKVFSYLSNVIVEEFYTDNDLSVKLWKGFRLLAVDGSHLILPQTKELKEIYGVTTNQTKTEIVQARVSVLYDVLNNFVIDGQLSPLNIGEIQLAKNHLKATNQDDLIIYDRGYPSFDLVFEHLTQNRNFVIRVRLGFSTVVKDFVASKKTTQIVNIKPWANRDVSDKKYNRQTTVKVRLVLIILKDGTKEVLMTSLLNSKIYSSKLFKELYFKRWCVETFYDELKNKLKIEHFSGYSNQTILQDFNAALFVSNIQTLMVSEIQDELNKENNTKYQYKINTNLSYGFLKNRIIDLLSGHKDMDQVNIELKNIFKRHLIPIRPNRSNVRNTQKYRTISKPIVCKNRKDAL